MARKSNSLKDVLEFTQFLEGVSAKIHGLLDEAKIYKVIGKEFRKSRKYSATILRIDENGSQLVVVASSLSPTRRSKGGETTRLRLKGRGVDLSSSKVFVKVAKKGRTMQIALDDMIAEVIPGVRVHGLPRGRHAVATPLKKLRRTVGAFVVTAPSMSTQLVSSVKTFSRHISAAMELSEQYADRKRVEDELRSSREQLRNLSGYLQSVREEERSHVAREIHDELGQTITALKLDLLGLKDELSKKQKRLAKKAGSMVSLTDRSLQAVHKICGELRPKFLDDLGLTAALEWQAEEFEKRTGIDCAMEVEPQDLSVDSDLSIAVFRIFQEALTNVARHAGATKVEASLREMDGRVILEVKDNGRGITRGQVSHPKSFGLVGIGERVRPHGGELKIKGKRGKGTELTVLVPLEEAPLRPMVTPRMVGREKERRRLRSLYRKAEKMDGKLILVHGEAGIGKTRLVTEFAQDLETRGATVLTSACREDTRAIPYYPFREALNRFLDTRKQEGTKVFGNLPDYAKWELSRLLPDLKTPGLAEFEPAKDHFRLFESFRLFIQGLADQSNRPLFFAVEDLHVSDDASLDLLHYLARNLSKSGVQLCATYRTEETQGNVRKLTASLQKERLSANVVLNPLSSDEVSEMVDLLHPGSRAPRDLGELLYKRSEGNPFFVQEMTKLLTTGDAKEGVPRKKKVPRAIKSVLQRRIDTLGPGPREILSCGALVGEEFEFEVLQTALGRAPMEVMEAVESGTRAYIVRESPGGKEERYRFTHSLMADVLYSGIGKVRRKLWHSKVGDALEQHYADRLEVLNGRLTHHFELAENWQKAFTYALASARQAKDAYANEQAVSSYRRALGAFHRMTEETKEDYRGRLVGLHSEAARLLTRLARYDEALQSAAGMRKQALLKNDRNAEMRALIAKARIHRVKGCTEGAIKLYTQALALAKMLGDELAVSDSLIGLGHCHDLRSRYGKARCYFEKSLAISKEAGDKGRKASSLAGIGKVYFRIASFDSALKHWEHAQALYEEIGDREAAYNITGNIGKLYFSSGDYKKAEKYLREALSWSRRTGARDQTASLLHVTGALLSECGSGPEALRMIQDGQAEFREIGDPLGTAICLQSLAALYKKRGDLGQALANCRDALALYRASGSRSGEAAGMLAMGVFLTWGSDFQKSLRFLKRSLDIFRETGGKQGVAKAVAAIGNVYLSTGSWDRALKHYRDAMAVFECLGSQVGLAATLHNISSVYLNKGDCGEALRFCERALEIQESAGHREFMGNHLRLMGKIHFTRASYTEALSHLRRALDLYREGQHEPGVISCILWEGAVKGHLGLQNEALELHVKSLSLARHTGMKEPEGLALAQLGMDMLSLGATKDGESKLKEALTIAGETGCAEVEALALSGLSELHIAHGHLTKVDELAQQIETLGERGGSKRYVAYASLLRARSHAPSQKSLAYARKALGLLGDTSMRESLWQTHQVIAKCLKNKSDRAGSKGHYLQAQRIIRDITSEITNARMRKSYLNRPDIKKLFAELEEFEHKKLPKTKS